MLETEGKPRMKRITCAADAIVLFLLCGLAFYLTVESGTRGFYPFDQSIVFDGSYRVLSGQVPYRDFVVPFGPVVLWLHGFFFGVFGVTYLAYVSGAATVNVLAVACSVIAVRLLFPTGRLLSYAAGILTAVWFYPPFGTPWADQTAFFFSYLGIVLLLGAILGAERRKRLGDLALVVSGVAAFLAVAAKQNAGGFMLPMYPIVLGAAYLPDSKRTLRRLGLFLAGFGASTAAFAVWLATQSNVDNFIQYFFKLASALGTRRLDALLRTRFGLARAVGGRQWPVSASAIMIVSLVVAVVAMVMLILWHRKAEPGDHGRDRVQCRLLLASLLSIYLVVFQQAFMSTTRNQPENTLPFLGLVLAVAAGLLLHSLRASWFHVGQKRNRSGLRKVLAGCVWTGVIAAVVVSSANGVRVSMNRKVQDIFRGCDFGRPIETGGLKGLRWADPTRLRGADIQERDVLNLVAFLKKRGGNFLVFPDFTILYGVVGVPSPQPLLWFHDRVTYSRGRTSWIDSWIVGDLEKNHIRTVVLEEVAWYKPAERLDDFPQLKSYVHANFVLRSRIGIFQIYEKGEDTD